MKFGVVVQDNVETEQTEKENKKLAKQQMIMNSDKRQN